MKSDELLELIKTRRSIRKFKNESVPRQDIEKMIEAASWAPSGSNLQNWRFVIIESQEMKNAMAEALKIRIEELSNKILSDTAKREYAAYSNYYTFFTSAPVVIAAVKKPYDSLAVRIMERYGLGGEISSNAGVHGVAAAIDNLLLMAHGLGYGSCWMTGPLIARKQFEEMLGIKQPEELAALLPLGRPDTLPNPPKRKSVIEIIEYK